MTIKNKSRYDIFRDGLTLGEINSLKNIANGLCGLDENAKVPIAQLPDSITGAIYYLGTWDCSTGSYPVGPNQGDYYICNVEGTIGAVDYLVADWLVYNGSTWDKIDNSYGHDHDYRYYTLTEIDTFLVQDDNASVPSGFPNRDDSVISFDDGTLTFSITPSGADFDVYSDRILYTFDEAQTATITDTEGMWHFYFDTDGVLQSTQTLAESLILKYAYISNGYWDADANTLILVADERHGLTMNPMTHLYLHDTVGTRFQEGLGLVSIVSDGDGNLDASAQFGYGTGIIWDEDIKFDFSGVASPAQIPVFYKTGTFGYWRKDTATNFPVKNFVGGDSRLAYNEWTGTTWQQTEITNNDFGLCHLFATNDSNQPIISIQGQGDFTRLNQAREAAATEINNLITTGMPFQEFLAIASVIYQTSNGYTNDVKSRIRTTDTGDDYIDFRYSFGGGTAGSVNDHGSLSGLDDDDHTQYMLRTDLAETTQGDTAGMYDVGFPVINTPVCDSLGCIINKSLSAGVLTGGSITDVGSNTIDVAAGTGLIKALDLEDDELLAFEWPELTGYVVPSDSVRYVGVEYNAGTPQIVIKTTDTWDLDTDFPLGKVVRNDNLHTLNDPWWVGDIHTNILERFQGIGKFTRDAFIGGLMISVPGTRNLAITAGSVWTHINEFEISSLDTSISGTFAISWVDTIGNHTESSVSQYPIGQWNDLTEDTLQTISNNDYANWWVYAEVEHDVLHLVYPQNVYSNSASAEVETAPVNIPLHVQETAILVGRILFQQGNDTPIAVQSAFETSFSASLVADHGNLAGLSGNDHPQYALVSDRFVSTEQTGTASQQTIAHGLSGTPTGVLVSVTDDNSGGGFVITEGTHDSTNVYVTCTTDVKYKVLAFL